MKRILTVQDLSCLGKCSLTVALPVISAMGVEAAVLPTAVLSTHTAFSSPAVQDLTQMLTAAPQHWEQIGATFDGIYTGYLSCEEQVDRVLAIAEQFRSPDCFLMVDPVMGDGGKLYSRITPNMSQKLRRLCSRADVVVPNLTEACCLTDTPYRDDPDEAFIKELLHKLTENGSAVAMITGVSFSKDQIGIAGYEKATDTYLYYSHQKLSVSLHGTGDVFSAVCTGALAQGKSWNDAMTLAGDFTLRCMEQTLAQPRDPRFGLCFEAALPYLMK